MFLHCGRIPNLDWFPPDSQKMSTPKQNKVLRELKAPESSGLLWRFQCCRIAYSKNMEPARTMKNGYIAFKLRWSFTYALQHAVVLQYKKMSFRFGNLRKHKDFF